MKRGDTLRLLPLIFVVSHAQKSNLTLWRSEPPTLEINWEEQQKIMTDNNDQWGKIFVQSGQRINIAHTSSASSSIGIRIGSDLAFQSCLVPPNDSLSFPLVTRISLEPKETGSVLILEVDSKSGKCVSANSRLNVTWVGRECGPDLCARNGACALSTEKEVFTCFCCRETEWSLREVGGVCPACNASSCCGEAMAELELDSVDTCSPNPCRNGGICNTEVIDQDSLAHFTCLCPQLYSGTFCEIKAEKTCTKHSCPPRSYCFMDADNIECVPEYRKGLLPKCHPNICYNRGQCHIVRGVPRCLCESSFVGIFCKSNIDELESSESVESGGAWVALAGFLAAFSAAALMLLVCNCHTYSCQILPSTNRRRDYKWTSPKERRGTKVDGEGFQMSTVDDLSIPSSSEVITPESVGNHFGSERDLLVSKA